MPPETPSRTRTGRASLRRRLPVAVLDLALGDFLQGDRQVVLGDGLHHRGRVLLEGPLAEVVVVRVDLAGALGGHDHARVVGVDVLEQSIDAGRDHRTPVYSRTSATNAVTASSRRSLTMKWGNSLCAASSSRATARRFCMSSGLVSPRPTSRARSASSDGGRMKICTASGIVSRTCRAPWSSISSTTGSPACR